jgi:hypothetical protein
VLSGGAEGCAEVDQHPRMLEPRRRGFQDRGCLRQPFRSVCAVTDERLRTQRDAQGAPGTERPGAGHVLAGLERDETPGSLRRLIERSGGRYDADFVPSTQLLHASGVLRAAAGNHETAIRELEGWPREHPVFAGENPAVLAWRSAAALSLAELGRHGEARSLTVGAGELA